MWLFIFQLLAENDILKENAAKEAFEARCRSSQTGVDLASTSTIATQTMPPNTTSFGAQFVSSSVSFGAFNYLLGSY